MKDKQPVAWARFNGASVSINKMYEDDYPLYRLLQTQSSLSDSDILRLRDEHDSNADYGGDIDQYDIAFARSIEVEHGIVYDKTDDKPLYKKEYEYAKSVAYAYMIRAEEEIARLNQALINIHDRLLRGDSDVELLEMLSSALTKNND
jgi:hypothetical protein